MPLAIQVVSEPQPLAESSLKSGIFLTVKQLHSMLAAFEIKEPEPGTGSGKNKRVIKVDLATRLIETLFPDATDQERAFMITSTMVRKQINLEEAPELLLKMTSYLDTNEVQHFSKVRKAAVDQLAVESMKQNLARRQKKGEQDDDGDCPEGPASSKIKPKRPLEEPGAPAPPTKRLRSDAELHAEKLGRLNCKAPPEFLALFPLCSYCYFKWLPHNSRVTVEFKQRFLDFFLAALLFTKKTSWRVVEVGWRLLTGDSGRLRVNVSLFCRHLKPLRCERCPTYQITTLVHQQRSRERD